MKEENRGLRNTILGFGVLIVIAIVMQCSEASVNCGPSPLIPIGCTPPAVCFCDEYGNCEWRFECE